MTRPRSPVQITALGTIALPHTQERHVRQPSQACAGTWKIQRKAERNQLTKCHAASLMQRSMSPWCRIDCARRFSRPSLAWLHDVGSGQRTRDLRHTRDLRGHEDAAISRRSSRDGPCDPRPGYARQRGRRMPADRPITSQALPSGSATKRVPPFDFTRNNSVRLPSLRASAICVRTSAGLETDLPLTSRMTSPTWKP